MHALIVGILCFVTAISGVSLLAGCSLTGRHRLEASLRRHEARIRDLKQQLSDQQELLRDQENELQVLKQPVADSPFQSTTSSRSLESNVAWGAVHQLRIHALASGVLRSSEDQLTLNAIIQPIDRDREVIKVAGNLAIEVQRPGDTSFLAEKHMTPLESRSAWNNGVIARGFQVAVPLDPQSELNDRVLVTATLKLDGGRSFEATRLVRVPR